MVVMSCCWWTMGWGLVLCGLKVEEDGMSKDGRWREDGRKQDLSELWRYEFIDFPISLPTPYVVKIS